MPSRFFRWDGDSVVDCGVSDSTGEASLSAAVIDDTMAPLKHPVTGKMYDSKRAYLADTRRMGYEVVGTDLLSRQKHTPRDKLTTQRVLDATQRAEATISDPAKLNAARNQLIEKHFRHEAFLERMRNR